MRFLFLIQGEGRGHMTQAITLAQILEEQGHELVGAVIGKSKRRKIPQFLIEGLNTHLLKLESPNFKTDKKSKQVLIWRTLSYNLGRAGKYQISLQKLDKLVKKSQPDVILNFYDVLGGLYFLLYRPTAMHWVIGHQYLSLQKGHLFPKKRGLDKAMYQLNTRLTALFAKEKIALSFTEVQERSEIKVFPPLIREKVKSQIILNAGFFLAYMVNDGYAEEVLEFASSNPDISIKAFWDRKGINEVQKPLPNLELHPIHDINFLEAMAQCEGLVSTAGFESICEALYLGKPVLVIPVKGQYEQLCNAHEIELLQIGKQHHEFDFHKIPQQDSSVDEKVQKFREWESNWSIKFMNLCSEYEEEALVDSNDNKLELDLEVNYSN
ncbi:glycosyltransferase family protein [Algoriphagus sediminis]|uniref:Glycosyltransferase family protein n=1 Tax=Algoriphagus sediminis TaxID=3057113 RepID=A0ABT7Y8P5_9BACT|nr:glycosyltransferase family protein [Algoriphagus sediminis]MDN3202879.1 glycosyltransferase family protein [Algoriphagus sediminis]